MSPFEIKWLGTNDFDQNIVEIIDELRDHASEQLPPYSCELPIVSADDITPAQN